MTLRRPAIVYAEEHARFPSPSVCEAGAREAPKPRLLDRMREALRVRRYSRRTEEAYVAWARRYILFHGKLHPETLGAPEVTSFLTSLAVGGRTCEIRCQLSQPIPTSSSAQASLTAENGRGAQQP